MKKIVLAVVSLVALAAAPAHARTNISFGFFAPAPVYYEPAPVYYQPPPVVYYPPVRNVYYAPPVYGYGVGYGYNYGHHDRFRRGYNTAWNGYGRGDDDRGGYHGRDRDGDRGHGRH